MGDFDFAAMYAIAPFSATMWLETFKLKKDWILLKFRGYNDFEGACETTNNPFQINFNDNFVY